MKRKSAVILAAIVLMMTVLTGCQGSAGTEQKQSASSSQLSSSGTSSVSDSQSSSGEETASSSTESGKESSEEKSSETSVSESTTEQASENSEQSVTDESVSTTNSQETSKEISQMEQKTTLASTMMSEEEQKQVSAVYAESGHSDYTPIGIIGLQVVAGYNELILTQKADGSWYIAEVYLMPDETMSFTGIKELAMDQVRTVDSSSEIMPGALEGVSVKGEVPAGNLSGLPSSARDIMAEKDYHPIAVVSENEPSLDQYIVCAQKSNGVQTATYLLTFSVKSDGSAELASAGQIELSYYMN